MLKCKKCGYEEPKKEVEGFELFWKVYPRRVGKGLG